MTTIETFGGFRVTVVRPRVTTKRRGWRERLTGWPWRPWQAEETVTTEILAPGAALVVGRMVYLGEQAHRDLLKMLEETKPFGHLSPPQQEPESYVISGLSIADLQRAISDVRKMSPNLSPEVSPHNAPRSRP